MSNQAPDYMTYLLRLWRSGNAGRQDWRAVLVNPRTGERQAFGDLPSLFAFLEDKTRSVTPDVGKSPPVSD